TGASKVRWDPSGRVTTGIARSLSSGDRYQGPRAKRQILSEHPEKATGKVTYQARIYRLRRQ
ncbi:MAG: hypothetical protein VW806_14645, partial [Halieaceae bacterium]